MDAAVDPRPEALTAQLREQLMALGARRWQVDLVLDALVDATLRADEPVAEQVAGTDEAQPEG
ncbi:hypothetical protein [Nocardioides daphniae]|uniref:hypothetical protein n=1 Tax=Nocardioides daphniae TaxID=402297 RepID=UPI0026BB7002